MLDVRLRPGLPDCRWARLRELSGHDEASVDATTGPVAATELIERLLVESPGPVLGRGRVWDLTVADRDRLVAELYRHCYGDRIEGRSRCRGCGEGFEVAFSLRELAAGLEPGDAEGVEGPDDEGVYTLADGTRFRLPTPADERAVSGLEPAAARAELLGRCRIDESPEASAERLEAAMERLGPVLVLDLPAACPHCDAEQTVRFDVQAQLLGALAAERPWLIREVHRLALAYGWSRSEILGLSRDERRTHVRLIEADRPPRSPRGGRP